MALNVHLYWMTNSLQFEKFMYSRPCAHRIYFPCIASLVFCYGWASVLAVSLLNCRCNLLFCTVCFAIIWCSSSSKDFIHRWWPFSSAARQEALYAHYWFHGVAWQQNCCQYLRADLQSVALTRSGGTCWQFGAACSAEQRVYNSCRAVLKAKFAIQKQACE